MFCFCFTFENGQIPNIVSVQKTMSMIGKKMFWILSSCRFGSRTGELCPNRRVSEPFCDDSSDYRLAVRWNNVLNFIIVPAWNSNRARVITCIVVSCIDFPLKTVNSQYPIRVNENSHSNSKMGHNYNQIDKTRSIHSHLKASK